jgi:hypothetical protein
MTSDDVTRELAESRRLFELAVLVRRADPDPTRGAHLAREALVRLARAICLGRGEPQDLALETDALIARAEQLSVRFCLVETKLPETLAMLDRVAAGLSLGAQKVSEEDSTAYAALLDGESRLSLQAAHGLKKPAPPPRTRMRNIAMLALGAAAVVGLAWFAFGLVGKERPLPVRVFAAPGSDAGGLLLPATVELNGAQAAEGPVGDAISVAGSAGAHRVTVAARGTECAATREPSTDPGARFPMLEMRIDGKPAHAWYVDSDQTKDYSFGPFTLDASPHQIQFFFIGDFYEQGRCDRNVWVTRVTFE